MPREVVGSGHDVPSGLEGHPTVVDVNEAVSFKSGSSGQVGRFGISDNAGDGCCAELAAVIGLIGD
jgi:hypothetical protein